MVTPVFGIRCPVFRKSDEVREIIKLPIVMLKHIFLLFFFLSTEYCTLSAVHARDLGTHGIIYPIAEEDPIVLIQNKLKKMKASGELGRHYKALQKKTKAALERPQPVGGITKAVKARVFHYDPTYVVKEEIKDHTGKVLASQGAKINPFETVSLSQNLLFFDGDDPDQVAFAKEKLKQDQVKLILVKGAPLALSEEFKAPVYFDQEGRLTQHLGIHHVPAIVTQEGLRLRIEEVDLNTEKSDLPELKGENSNKINNDPSKIKKGDLK